MAVNPKTLKSLFGKLTPYADDVAKGVANYGDDIAKAATKQSDNVAKSLIADNAGRAAMSTDLLDDAFLDALEDVPRNATLTDAFDDLNFKSLSSTAPPYDYTDYLKQVAEDSAYRDSRFNKLSERNLKKFKFDTMDANLRNGKRVNSNNVPEYLEALANPTSLWRTSNPLKDNDVRLNALYAQLQNDLETANNLEKNGYTAYNFPSKESLNSSINEVKRLQNLLKPVEQFEIDF